MAKRTLDPLFQDLLQGRYIATLATENEDGSMYLTAVWYLFEGGHFYIATAGTTRKARNVGARSKASLMIDARKPGTERGIAVTGEANLIGGELAKQLNHKIHARYMSAEAIADPGVGPVFASFDDVTVQFKPEKWSTWNMKMLDAQAFGGKLGGTPGYLLPLD
jgi:nitroimidazol reductase NimA-like FMN-containing flavoprotein (pyridoxamine 5'-phosphate oxidase superfamily)